VAKKKKITKRRHRFPFLFLALTVAAGLLSFSVATANVILPGVRIREVNVSGLSPAAATDRVIEWLSAQTYTLHYGAERWTATPAELGVSFDVDAAIQSAMRDGRTPVTLFSRSAVSLPVRIDADLLGAYLSRISQAVLTPPQDAGFTVVNGELAVSPAVDGFEFDLETVRDQLAAGSNVELRAVKVPARVSGDDVAGLIDEARLLTTSPVEVIVGTVRATAGSEIVRGWLAVLPDPLRLGLKTEAVEAWLADASRPAVVEPVAQQILKSEMKVEVVDEGRSGKILDMEDAVQKISDAAMGRSGRAVELALTEVPRPVAYVQAPPAPVSTGKAIGVDLTKQHGYVYQDGRLVYSMKISSGINDWTPTGTFKVYAKTKKQKMSGPGYYVPNVPNILWFQGDYSMHGVYWHNDFGIRPRSHGCVGQSVADSEFTYNFGEVGMPIVIYKS